MDRHVFFRVAREEYALPLAAVREVVVPGPLSRVPRSPDAVQGIMNLRGRIVTVVEMKVLLGLGPASADGVVEGKLLILDRGRRDLGLLVAEVLGIAEIKEVSPVASGGPAIRGVATPESLGVARMVTVLDADALDVQVAALFGGTTEQHAR
jgi:purine-binding chemotaxis protein CheW